MGWLDWQASAEVQFHRQIARVHGRSALRQDEYTTVSNGMRAVSVCLLLLTRLRCLTRTITSSANPSTRSATSSSPAAALEAKAL
jgi:hypothetical protein